MRNSLVLKAKIIQSILLGLIIGGVYFSQYKHDSYIDTKDGMKIINLLFIKFIIKL